jgi:hypothetical protein
MLALQGVRQIQPFGGILSVIDEHPYIATTGQIRKFKHNSPSNGHRPMPSAWNTFDVITHHGVSIPFSICSIGIKPYRSFVRLFGKAERTLTLTA